MGKGKIEAMILSIVKYYTRRDHLSIDDDIPEFNRNKTDEMLKSCFGIDSSNCKKINEVINLIK